MLPKLNNAITAHCKLIVDLDGSAGYSTSFLEEAFGGLIRHNNISYDVINDTIIIKSEEDPSYLTDSDEYNRVEDSYECVRVTRGNIYLNNSIKPIIDNTITSIKDIVLKLKIDINNKL